MKSVWLFFIMVGVFFLQSPLADISHDLNRIGPAISCAIR